MKREGARHLFVFLVPVVLVLVLVLVLSLGLSLSLGISLDLVHLLLHGGGAKLVALILHPFSLLRSETVQERGTAHRTTLS